MTLGGRLETESGLVALAVVDFLRRKSWASRWRRGGAYAAATVLVSCTAANAVAMVDASWVAAAIPDVEMSGGRS